MCLPVRRRRRERYHRHPSWGPWDSVGSWYRWPWGRTPWRCSWSGCPWRGCPSPWQSRRRSVDCWRVLGGTCRWGVWLRASPSLQSVPCSVTVKHCLCCTVVCRLTPTPVKPLLIYNTTQLWYFSYSFSMIPFQFSYVKPSWPKIDLLARHPFL